MSADVRFADGPLAGRTINYWQAADHLEGPWPGRYDLVNVIRPDDECLKVAQEYRYRPDFAMSRLLGE